MRTREGITKSDGGSDLLLPLRKVRISLILNCGFPVCTVESGIMAGGSEFCARLLSR